MTQAELPQQHEQVHLADAQLDVATAGRRCPLQQAVTAAVVVADGVRIDAGLVDPSAEVRRDRHIGRGRHDSGTQLLDLGQRRQDTTEGLLGRYLAIRDRRATVLGHVVLAPVTVSRAPERSPDTVTQFGRARSLREWIPLVRRLEAHRGPEGVDLICGEQARVIQRVSRDGQAPPFDGVGEQHCGLVADTVTLAQLSREQFEIVTTEVGDQRRQLLIAVSVGKSDHRRVRLTTQLCPDLGRAEPEECLVCLVRHGIDVGPECVSVGFRERRRQPRAVLGFGDMPPGIGEEPLQPLRGDVGYDPIQALPVEVDDHGEIGQALGGRIGDRLPHVALVELGIADDREEPRPFALTEV